MATLGTFTAGQVLTAAELNAIGTWTDFTPNIRSTGGTITTVALREAKYTQINDVVMFVLIYQITNVGTGTGDVLFDLPATASSYTALTGGSGIGAGRENINNGKMMAVVLNTATTGTLRYYDNTGTVAANQGGGVFGVYRSA